MVYKFNGLHCSIIRKQRVDWRSRWPIRLLSPPPPHPPALMSSIKGPCPRDRSLLTERQPAEGRVFEYRILWETFHIQLTKMVTSILEQMLPCSLPDSNVLKASTILGPPNSKTSETQEQQIEWGFQTPASRPHIHHTQLTAIQTSSSFCR